MSKLVYVAAAAMLSAVPLQAAPRLAPQERLANLIDGRVAGAPVSCISLRSIRSTEIIDGTAIVYRAGNTVYVNTPRSGAESLRRSDAFVTRRFSPRLCNTEVLQVYDPGTGISRGSVFLDEFVPYRGRGLTRR